MDSECFDAFLSRCAICHYPILSHDYVCSHCFGSLQYTIHCVARYDGNLSHAVLENFKFRSDASMAPVIAMYLDKALSILDPEHEALLVPVPCSKESLRRNGWDHMQLVCKYLHRPTMDLVINKDFGTQQKRLDRLSRIESAKSRFQFNSKYCKELDTLCKRRIIVVDDICTTMSTINSAMDLLRSKGFNDVKGASWLLDLLTESD